MEDIAEEGEEAERMVQHRENTFEKAGNPANPETRQDAGKHSSLPTISAILPNENDQGNKKAVRQWKKIRESLSTIIGREKKKDISKMSMLELTSLFEGIRDCRYLRVGAHTSYRETVSTANTADVLLVRWWTKPSLGIIWVHPNSVYSYLYSYLCEVAAKYQRFFFKSLDDKVSYRFFESTTIFFNLLKKICDKNFNFIQDTINVQIKQNFCCFFAAVINDFFFCLGFSLLPFRSDGPVRIT